MIYLDSAATTLQKPPAVLRAVQFAMEHYTTPGRGGHKPAMDAAEAVYACRETAAELFGCDPEQVVFTMNATHGLNMAIHTLVRPGGRVVVSALAHNAVMRPLRARGADVHMVGTRLFAPELLLRELERAVTYDTSAVVLTHVSNVFGDILPLEAAAEICRQREVPLIVDAAQSAGILPLSLRELGAAFIAMPGHKSLYGPQGTGLLLCGTMPRPLLLGGTGGDSRLPLMPDYLPDRAEAGTANTAGICGLHEGLKFAAENRERAAAHERALAAALCAELETVPELEVFHGGNQTGVVSFRTPRMGCEELAGRLDEAGICVRAGLHCAPEAHRRAGTLATGTVRVSFSIFNTERETEQTAAVLKKILLLNQKKL